MFPITQKFIGGHNRPNRKLDALRSVIIHWTANTNRGANAMANRNYFNSAHYDAKGKLIYASAHFIVDSTSIVQCLPEDEVGFHVGAKPNRYTAEARRIMGTSASPNYVTLGIEMCVNSDGDFDITRAQTVELSRHLANKHGIGRENVLRHFDITGKDCPRMMLEQSVWDSFLDEVFNGASLRPSYRVNVSALNVRSGPGTNYAVLRQLHLGDTVEITNKVGLWGEIATGEFVHRDYIKKI